MPYDSICGRTSTDHKTLEVGRLCRENTIYPRPDGQELRLEDGPRMDEWRGFLGNDWWLHSRLDELRGEEKFTNYIWGDNLRKREVEAHDSIAPRRSLLNKVVEDVPLTTGILIPDMLAR